MNITRDCKICCIFLAFSLIALGTLGIYTYRKEHVAIEAEQNGTKRDESTHFITTPFDIKELRIGDGLEELIKNKFISDHDSAKIFFQEQIQQHKYIQCFRKYDAYTYLYCAKHISEYESFFSFNIEIIKEVPEEVYFEFENSKLMKAMVIFEEKYFSTVVEAALLKYGKPTTISSQTLHNKLTGIESQDINIVYKNNINNTTLVLSNHKKEGDSYIPQGMILLFSNAYIEAQNKESKPAETDL